MAVGRRKQRLLGDEFPPSGSPTVAGTVQIDQIAQSNPANDSRIASAIHVRKQIPAYDPLLPRLAGTPARTRSAMVGK